MFNWQIIHHFRRRMKEGKKLTRHGKTDIERYERPTPSLLTNHNCLLRSQKFTQLHLNSKHIYMPMSEHIGLQQTKVSSLNLRHKWCAMLFPPTLSASLDRKFIATPQIHFFFPFRHLNLLATPLSSLLYCACYGTEYPQKSITSCREALSPLPASQSQRVLLQSLFLDLLQLSKPPFQSPEIGPGHW